MDSITWNEIFLENEGMIWRVIRRNWPLIRALRLDQDDVYQELAVAALDAIDSFDPMRSECIQAHIWMKMQYLKKEHPSIYEASLKATQSRKVKVSIQPA